MRIKAQLAMVMNLDKCIGCHTCSIPCKNVWTNRKGAEYIWYNNVETKPGIGYPKEWENQEIHRGGWALKKDRLDLLAGGRTAKLFKIFHNPDLPAIDAYYEPWTYDYGKLVTSPPRKHQPSLRPRSLITGKNMHITWGPNWEDDLAGVHETGGKDTNFSGLNPGEYLQFEKAFMMYLPRICEHCLNPSCVASCPSGALYKRDEDGIVLVDQERCRGWRFCVSGCPYKKVYYNWDTGRSEKCVFCYPRVEDGVPTLCAETCVGRIRYIGVLLYDADRIGETAASPDSRMLYENHRSLFLDPNDPAIRKEAMACGVPPGYVEAACRSPVYKLIVDWQLALPPHPEFRTLPMVWYIPPLSPLVRAQVKETEDEQLIEGMRIPVRYLANLLAAGDEGPVRRVLQRLVALRRYMRAKRLGTPSAAAALEQAGLPPDAAEEIFRLLAVAKYGERYVLPTRMAEGHGDANRAQGSTGYNE